MTITNIKDLLLDEFVFCRASISQWSGKVALSFEGDLGVRNEEKILNGQKAICPAELLRPFNALDKWMRDRLDKIGVQHLGPGIWAVPVSRIDELHALFQDTQERFDEALARFEMEYDDACEKFFAGKSYEFIMRQSKMPVAKVLSKFRFANAIFQFADSEHSRGVDRESLFDSFTMSIAAQARDIFVRWEERKKTEELGSSSIRSLHDLRDKIKGFETVSPHAFALGRHLDVMLADLPKGTKATGFQISQAYAIVTLLKDEENLRDFGNSVLHTMQSNEDNPLPALEQPSPPLADDPEEFDLPDDVLAAFFNEETEPQETITVSANDTNIPFADAPVPGNGTEEIPFAEPVSIVSEDKETQTTVADIPQAASF